MKTIRQLYTGNLFGFMRPYVFTMRKPSALKSQLVVIQSLVFLLPALVLLYIFNKENVSFDTNQVLMLVGMLVILLGGLLILHRIFDRLQKLQDLMAGAVTGKFSARVETVETGEIHEVVASCNNLMQHYEQANIELEEHASELRAVHSLSEMASRTLDLNVLLKTLLENAISITGAIAGAVYTINSQTNTSKLVGSRYMGKLTEGPIDGGLTEPQLRQILAQKHAFLTDLDWCEDGEAMAQIILPIFVREQPVAILTLSACRPILLAKTSPSELFSLMLREVGYILENAILHRNLEQKVDERTSELAQRNHDMLQEIKKRKETESALEAAKVEAEAANLAKTRFLSSMSHEIRTPMNGVLGMVELLQNTDLHSEQRHMLRTISSSGQLLMNIISDILDFSKIEADKMELEAIPLSVVDVLEEATRSIAINATKKGLRLITFVDPNLPHYVIGDPGRLSQIILNLVGNAIKFTDKGDVIIRADAVNDGRDSRTTIRFSVIDQGIGISEEGQGRLFHFFSQVETSTTRQFGGTGLGLAICKSLTELMGGEISVNSQLGEGAEFVVTIPFAPCDKQLEEFTEINLSRLRVLVANDNSTEQVILRKYLEHWGVEVEHGVELHNILDLCISASDSGAPFDVVVLGSNWTYEEIVPIGDAVKESGIKTRFVFLLKGTRHRVRVDADERVFLDVNPLHRSAFFSAVAIAAKIISPENYYKENFKNIKPSGCSLTLEDARTRGTLILVAEDNADNRNLLELQLILLGYACESVEDGRLALDMWRSNEYAVILTDCKMPNMGGIELSRAIRQDEAGSNNHQTIIAITGNALERDKQLCLDAGMDDIITKPIDINGLRTILKKWMPITKPCID
ncbi:MAG: response regulator [Proteobacteria bacterium]|nr:response regulator [Pseudomonadota bacterium]